MIQAEAEELANDRRIRTALCPNCLLCGAAGQYLYRDLKDRLFGAEGSWNLKSCADPDCGLIWLDPMPLREDIGKAYFSYYTHASQDEAGRKNLLKRIYAEMKLGYFANKYGYPAGCRPFFRKNLGRLVHLFPIRRRGLDGDVRFLNAVPQGRVLDVGCGSGDWLALMNGLGWQSVGVDFDDNAVKFARARGLEVTCGALEQQRYPDDSFDAVTLSHVIEHVPDPLQTLTECLRILKPGGKLAVDTPNASSLSHRMFKQDWRGLEPPRHLHIFSYQSLPALLIRAGFKNVTVHPHMASSVFYESLRLRRGAKTASIGKRRDRVSGAMTHLLMLLQFSVLQWQPGVSDCVAAVATKA